MRVERAQLPQPADDFVANSKLPGLTTSICRVKIEMIALSVEREYNVRI